MTQEALQLPTTPPYPGGMMVDDINKALATLASNCAGDAEPGNPYPYQWWAHGASGWMKQRNAANSVWINRFKLADAMSAVGAALFAAASDSAARAALSVFSASEYQIQIASRFTAGGTADAMTGALAPVVAAYANGLRVTCTPPGANTLTAPTLELHTLGGKKIFKRAGGAAVALAPGDYNGSGPFDFEFVPTLDTGAGGWILLSPLAKSNSSVGLFYKVDPTTVAFVKTGAGTASIKAGTKVDVAGTEVTFSAATAIAMPSLTAGTDYAIWVKDDATIQATSNFSTAPGSGNWRKIGGFHYAPGGNAAAQAGGDTTPAINAYSFWDLKFRPACPDPRGMTLVADSFWADIYLLGVDHPTNGTSKYNVSIADGSAPPKIPTKFGGNGSTAYSTLTWWEANEVLQSWGKRSPTYDEFAALAYGTTEATSSGGSDVPTTGVSGTGATNAWNKFTSRWGVVQSSGCLYIWGKEFGGGAASTGWAVNTGGRGSTFQIENASRFGGYWDDTGNPGSRCSAWASSASFSANYISVRGVCDHVVVE